MATFFTRARGMYHKMTVDEIIAKGMVCGATGGLGFACYDIYKGNNSDKHSYYVQDVQDSMIKSVAYVGTGAAMGAVFSVTWPFVVPTAGIGALAHILSKKNEKH